MRKRELWGKDMTKNKTKKKNRKRTKNREIKRRTEEPNISARLTHWISWLMWLCEIVLLASGSCVNSPWPFLYIVMQNDYTVSWLKPNKDKKKFNISPECTYLCCFTAASLAWIYLCGVHYSCLTRLFQWTSPTMANPWFQRTTSFSQDGWKGEWVKFLPIKCGDKMYYCYSKWTWYLLLLWNYSLCSSCKCQILLKPA